MHRATLCLSAVAFAVCACACACSSADPEESSLAPLEAHAVAPVALPWGKIIGIQPAGGLMMRHSTGAWSVVGYAYTGAGIVGAGAFLGSPTLSPALQGLDAISANLDLGCGRNATEVLCWGLNNVGQLGSPPSGVRPPTRMKLPFTALHVVAGPQLSAAVLDDGSVWRWGIYDDVDQYSAPVPQPGLPRMKRLLCVSAPFTCGIDDDEQAWCWGADSVWEWDRWLAHTPEHQHDVPVRVPELDGVVELAFPLTNTLIRRLDGTVAGWGLNSTYALATGDKTPHDDFVPIELGSPVTALAPGAYHTCALVDDGTVYCWGLGLHGTLGQGNKLDQPLPVPVPGLPRVIGLSPLVYGMYALDELGRVWCWGIETGCPSSSSPVPMELPSLLRATGGTADP